MTFKDILYNIVVDNVYSKILKMESWILINMRACQVWIFCVTCDLRSLCRGGLSKHTWSVHQGVRCPCLQCYYQASLREDLSRHKPTHEGFKYSCLPLWSQSNTKGKLEQTYNLRTWGVRCQFGEHDFCWEGKWSWEVHGGNHSKKGNMIPVKIVIIYKWDII